MKNEQGIKIGKRLIIEIFIREKVPMDLGFMIYFLVDSWKNKFVLVLKNKYIL